MPSHRPLPAGFTLIELIIALALVGVLVAIAAPSFSEAMMSIRITGQTNDLISDLAFARSEAAKRNVPVNVCISSDGVTCTGTNWNAGWIVFPDVDGSGVQNGAAEATLKNRRALEGAPTLVLYCAAGSGGTATAVRYKPTGTSTATNSVFGLCDSRTTPNAGRTITINMTGRAVAAKTTCSSSAPSPTPTCP